MKILHLSDLHLNPHYHQFNIDKTKTILEKSLINGFDHLVVTGDIAHDADDESFNVFRNILKEFDLLDSKKTSITIGNHDIFGGVYSVKDLINFPERCINTNFEERVLKYVNHFEELFVDCYFPSKDKIFPYLKIVKDFAIIGINTNDVYSKIKNPFASNGKVSDLEFENLKKIFSQKDINEKRKIVLAHHHFYKSNYEVQGSTNDLWNKIEGYTLKLRGKKKLLKLLAKNKVEMIFHGHSHENREYNRKGIVCINSGGSVDIEDQTIATSNYVKVTQQKIEINFEEIVLPKVEIIPALAV